MTSCARRSSSSRSRRSACAFRRVLAICDDTDVLGVPFYVMAYVDGLVVEQELPSPLDRDEAARRALGLELVDVLAEIHAVSGDEPALAGFRRPGSYVERQLRRFTELWSVNATRSIPAVDELTWRLRADAPEPVAAAVVHGDFRLGNMLVGREDAVADRGRRRLGDGRGRGSAGRRGLPARHVRGAGGEPSPVGGSPATRAAGFPSKRELVERYAVRTGTEPDRLEWFVALALWKAAIFCDAIYGRYVRGELAAGDDSAAIFEAGVPLMAERALLALEASARR